MTKIEKEISKLNAECQQTNGGGTVKTNRDTIKTTIDNVVKNITTVQLKIKPSYNSKEEICSLISDINSLKLRYYMNMISHNLDIMKDKYYSKEVTK